jgi:hypothetical protein
MRKTWHLRLNLQVVLELLPVQRVPEFVLQRSLGAKVQIVVRLRTHLFVVVLHYVRPQSRFHLKLQVGLGLPVLVRAGTSGLKSKG